MIEKVLKTTTPACIGYCSHCETVHQLPQGNCYDYGFKLLQQIEQFTCIDFLINQEQRDPRFKTDFLYGEARGKMFGVLECLTSDGSKTFLHGFSGQYNGCWLVNGWVGPLFDVDEWYETNDDVEKEIKRLTRKIDTNDKGIDLINKLKSRRKQLSQQLMKDLHSLYRLTNFRGETTTLSQLFPDNMPTGTGDCCGPKLLNHAAQNNLLPVSMAEFYIGKENRSGSKTHGQFYNSCKEKCQPLLGFMLCGLDTK